VALGPSEDSWLLVLDEDDGDQERQIHLYHNIPEDMVQVRETFERKRTPSVFCQVLHDNASSGPKTPTYGHGG
jgi:hypothetical protein